MQHIASFGDSYSARLAYGPGAGNVVDAPWELSASAASVRETHHGVAVRTTLVNAAVRHERAIAAGTQLYGLVEASRAQDDEGDAGFALLGEAQLQRGVHRRTPASSSPPGRSIRGRVRRAPTASCGFLAVSAGARIFLGGGPMRMGACGVLDDMPLRHAPQPLPAQAAPPEPHLHH
jgi:hypothetical protein